MNAVYATLAGTAVALGVLVVVQTTGQSRLTRHLATAGGAVCLVLFVLINVSDWPGGFLNRFWLDHAIVGATAGTLLLGATVFLVYRYRDQQSQDEIDESIVDAGRSELVDCLVDIDVALSLLCSSTRPQLCENEHWHKSRHGLEWLREHLDESSLDDDAYWSLRDPRLAPPCGEAERERWRLLLMDQMVRRVASGVRDWGPILMKSRQGQQDLVAFAHVRPVLLRLDRGLRRDGRVNMEAVHELQATLRRFAQLLEVDGENPYPRAKLVVLASDPLAPAVVDTFQEKTVLALIDPIERHVKRRTRLVGQDFSLSPVPAGARWTTWARVLKERMVGRSQAVPVWWDD